MVVSMQTKVLIGPREFNLLKADNLPHHSNFQIQIKKKSIWINEADILLYFTKSIIAGNTVLGFLIIYIACEKIKIFIKFSKPWKKPVKVIIY